MSKRQRVECFRARCGLGRFPGVEPGFLGISSLVSIEIVSHGGHGGHGGSFWVERLDAEERELASAFFAGCSFLSKPSLSPPRLVNAVPLNNSQKPPCPPCPLCDVLSSDIDLGVQISAWPFRHPTYPPGLAAPDHTVPYGTVLSGDASQALRAWLRSLLSLWDEIHSPRRGFD
jgi:hypothetical protein